MRERKKGINNSVLLFKITTSITGLQESVYILTDLGQLPFTLFTQNSLNLDCPRDNVNTAILYSYSTLPHNGCIQRVRKELQVYTRLLGKSVLFELAKSGDGRPNQPGSEELKPILEKSIV